MSGSTSTGAYQIISRVCNHKQYCSGDMVCRVCGRKGCSGCIATISDEKGYKTPLENLGKCVVCNGIWKEETIVLYPPNNGEWDAKENLC